MSKGEVILTAFFSGRKKNREACYIELHTPQLFLGIVTRKCIHNWLDFKLMFCPSSTYFEILRKICGAGKIDWQSEQKSKNGNNCALHFNVTVELEIQSLRLSKTSK